MKSSNQTKRINPRLFLLAALVVGLLALGGTHTARAAGIVVNSAADVIADDGQCTLREAITAANSDTASGATAGECAAGSGSDTITFAADYTITLVGSQLPVVTSAISINGNGPANTIIQANAAANTATYRMFSVNGSLTLDSVTVRHGRCPSCPGGGIYNSGTLTVTNSTLSGNNADRGGGIFSSNGTVTVTNSTLSGNSANEGGGISKEGGTVTVTNSTLSGNNANSNGGIYNLGGTMTVSNSTLSGNNASSGGGIYNYFATLTLVNSLILGSTSVNCQNSSGTLTADASNIADDASCGSATVKTAAEIALGPLTNNGGPTLTMALGSGSAAINAGNNAHANAAGLITDQRGTGFARISGGTVDVGAFEMQSVVCQPGSYDDGTGCVLADPGHYVPGAGATAQTPCAPGTYQPNSGASSCTLAEPGYYVDVTAATAQGACAAGSYQPSGGATGCILAEPGYYVPGAAAIAQIQCPAGTTSAAGATACTVTAFNFTGFFPPVDNLPMVNVVKAGQAIPIKFSLGGNQGLGIMAAGYPTSSVISCDNSATSGAVEETVTAGASSLSYDPATNQYIYVWKTNKAWGNSCRLFTIKLTDGTVHQASFKFNK